MSKEWAHQAKSTQRWEIVTIVIGLEDIEEWDETDGLVVGDKAMVT